MEQQDYTRKMIDELLKSRIRMRRVLLVRSTLGPLIKVSMEHGIKDIENLLDEMGVVYDG